MARQAPRTVECGTQGCQAGTAVGEEGKAMSVPVRFLRKQQAITGDWFRIYEAADDGEIIEVRQSCGSYASNYGRRELPANAQPWTDAECDAYASQELAACRTRRAER